MNFFLTENIERLNISHLKGKIIFGDSTLNRQGFAAVAIAAGVPIIPVFTENIREATLCLSGRMNVGRGLWEQIYEKTKMPLVPMYGLFPVKLRTHLGKPIFPKPGFYSFLSFSYNGFRDGTGGDGEFDIKCSPRDDQPAPTAAWQRQTGEH